MCKYCLFLLPFGIAFNSLAQSPNEINYLDSLAQIHMEGILNPQGGKPIYNTQMSVIYKDKYAFHGAAGQVSKKNKNIPDEQKFKIASVTKTFTSTIILQLMEEGLLNLDDPISKYFPNDLVDKLLILDRESYGKDITIRHLISHKSGLADYIFEDWKLLIAQKIYPKRAWNPEKILKIYFRHKMNKKGAGKPGELFHYSDTNYLLLALIIEQLTNGTLADAYQNRIAKPLGLTNTYLDPYDLETEGMMHQYSRRRSVTKSLNTSMDWGGGGIISTTRDLSVFIRALFNNELFQENSTLDLMITCSEKDEETWGYNYGIETKDIAKSVFVEGAKDSMTVYGHSGYWSVYMYHFPNEDITVVQSIGQVKDGDAYMPWARVVKNCFAIFEEE